MFTVHLSKRVLQFSFKAGTSRGWLTEHTAHYITLSADGRSGLGEAAPLKKLSIDDLPDFEERLQALSQTWPTILDQEENRSRLRLIQQTASFKEKLFLLHQVVSQMVDESLPAIRFALETALLDWLNGGTHLVFKNDFTQKGKPIPINGLIWMGTAEEMQQQIDKKLEEGYNCIKMKIGAIDFEQEISLIKQLRNRDPAGIITIRVDANGAFAAADALKKITRLAELGLHSIEQPIMAGQHDTIKQLCRHSPLPIALDEELIGIHDYENKKSLLQHIKPDYIILKPTLLGGMQATAEWIEAAHFADVKWWITSALESNIGLNAVCQFVANYPVELPQGLGTGQLYANNIDFPLTVSGGYIRYG